VKRCESGRGAADAVARAVSVPIARQLRYSCLAARRRTADAHAAAAADGTGPRPSAAAYGPLARSRRTAAD
jgi:hypothetical protein